MARDLRWGRTYESYGEDPGLVIKMETAIDGLQGPHACELDEPDRTLATAKHYAGDGDTEYGTGSGDYPIDQGVTVTSRREFARIDLAPYVAAVGRHDVGSVMPSFSSVDWTDDGVGDPLKMHAHRELITGTLKGRLGFDGFVISDWEGIHQIPGDYATQVRTGVKAGIDMFMEPFSYQDFETTLLAEVAAGRVSEARVDDAVRRILTKKFELGLFEHPLTDRRHLGEVGSPAHRALARRAVGSSQVLLRNRSKVLPLSGHERIYVAGSNADDIGNQAGGWTVAWQGLSGDTIPGTTILEGIRQVAPDAEVTFSEDASAPTGGNDVGIVVVGETPYAEGFGDVGGPLWQDNGVPREPQDDAAVGRRPGRRRPGLRVDRPLRGGCRLRPAAGPDRPARPDGRAGGVVASRQPGRGRRRRAVRGAAVHRPPLDDLAAQPRAGADQRRRPRLSPAVPLRLRPPHLGALRAPDGSPGAGGERLQVAGQAGLVGPRDLEVVEGHGQAGGQQHARVVHELEVQVGLGRVARVRRPPAAGRR